MSASREAYNLGYEQHAPDDDYADCLKRALTLHPDSSTRYEYYIEGWENARADLNESKRDCGDV